MRATTSSAAASEARDGGHPACGASSASLEIRPVAFGIYGWYQWSRSDATAGTNGMFCPPGISVALLTAEHNKN